MGEQKPEKTKKHICAGLLAHVSASWSKKKLRPETEMSRKLPDTVMR